MNDFPVRGDENVYNLPHQIIVNIVKKIVNLLIIKGGWRMNVIAWICILLFVGLLGLTIFETIQLNRREKYEKFDRMFKELLMSGITQIDKKIDDIKMKIARRN